MTNGEIRKTLFKEADARYQTFHTRLIPGEEKIIGVRLPVLRALAKAIAKGDYAAYLQAPNTEYHEERMLVGLVLGYIKTDTETLLNYVDAWVPHISNWAVCDSPVTSLRAFSQAKNRARVFAYLQEKLTADAPPYTLRFAVVALLAHFVGTEYDTAVAALLLSVQSEHYYVQMALAWAVCELLIKNYQEGIAILKTNRLAPFVQNKAIQKAKESYRLTSEQKNELAALKRMSVR